MIGSPFMRCWLCQDQRYVYLHITLPTHNAQMLEILVAREAGRVGGNFEEHATGFAEVDRVEILPVDLRRDIEPSRGQGLAPAGDP